MQWFLHAFPALRGGSRHGAGLKRLKFVNHFHAVFLDQSGGIISGQRISPEILSWAHDESNHQVRIVLVDSVSSLEVVWYLTNMSSAQSFGNELEKDGTGPWSELKLELVRAQAGLKNTLCAAKLLQLWLL